MVQTNEWYGDNTRPQVFTDAGAAALCLQKLPGWPSGTVTNTIALVLARVISCLHREMKPRKCSVIGVVVTTPIFV